MLTLLIFLMLDKVAISSVTVSLYSGYVFELTSTVTNPSPATSKSAQPILNSSFSPTASMNG